MAKKHKLRRKESKLVENRRRLFLSGLVLLMIVIVAAGCGPKGFIKGEAYSADGTILASQKLLVNVAGKSHIVTTAADGSFEISGIALGSQQVRVSFEDPDTGQQFHWQGAVQVGIQGAKIRVEFTGGLEGFDQLIEAVWRQLRAGEWEAARGHLESLGDYPLDPQQESTCELAWGWLYLRSGESHITAQQHFQKALTMGRVAEAQVGLAGVEATIGRYNEAIVQLEQALAQESYLQLDYPELNTGDLKVVLANLYLQIGDDTKALDILNRQTSGASSKGQRLREAILGFLAG